MDKDLIFLGESGITDTKANRIADFAKLSYTELETELCSIKFVSSSIETINGTDRKDVSYGVKSVDDIPAKVKKIGDLKALCAWLREAVAAHQRIILEKSTVTLHDYMVESGIEYAPKPVREATLTENDVIAGFDIKKRNRYFELEAHAATIGQLIHKGGPIDNARKTLYDKINNPRNVSGSGNDTIIWSFEPSIEKGKVESLFYGLQQEQAKYQSELNSIKSEIESRITNDEIDKAKKYDEEYSKWADEYANVNNKFAAWKSENSKKAAALKIVIPNSLKAIFDEVSAMGA